jgi:hypothetical protein
MAMLFLLAGRDLERVACPAGAPLFLDDDGRVVESGWRAAVVPFAAAAGAPRRWALVAAPGADAVVGGRVLREGVVELHDREHFLLAGCEGVLSTDAVPEPVPATEAPAVCPVCFEALKEERRLYRCGRCGAQACTTCWAVAPRGTCLTAQCGQPAALARELWAPAPAEFVSWEDPS